MPVYNSFISAPRIRLGHYHGHHKSSRTSSPAMDLPSSEPAAGKDKSKRRSLTDTPRSSASSIRSVSAEPTISMTIESPPLVCYGPPKESTGCLLSGLMHLTTDTAEPITSFTLTLERTVTYKHAAAPSCADCRTSTTTLTTWPLIAAPTTLRPGKHSYPFSHLFPGDTPASCDNALSTITYTLRATAVLPDSPTPLTFSRPLTIQRAILPGPDKHSIRIFPPTLLTATLTHPSVVHPGGDFPFTLTLSGVLNRPKNTRWRLRKLTYRIEETATTHPAGCPRHPAPPQHDDTRVLTSAELKRGWKSDFASADGKIELQAAANIPPHVRACCRIDFADRIAVRHVLVLECVVAEEYMETTHSKGATPTGAARVLRMQFQLNVTARSGLGISWDEEAPPVYEDVPEPPPGYERPPGYEVVVRQVPVE